MRIAPLGRARHRPLALLTPSRQRLLVETDDGESAHAGRRDVEDALSRLVGHACYVSSNTEAMKHVTSARDWTLSTWRGREVGIEHGPSGLKVMSLRGTLEASDHPYADLSRVAWWLRDYGVAMGSVSAMAWSLLRASLSTSVEVRQDPSITEPAFFGGRQQIFEPGLYHDVVALDTKAAYPAAQAARPYALAYRSVSPATRLDPEVAGLARAFVTVPDLPNAPLPRRLGPEAIQFFYGPLTGVWPWCELALAIDLGCDVEVLEAWAPRREGHLFDQWWEFARTGRSLPGEAAVLAKAIANSLWGQFAMRGDGRALVRWRDDAGDDPYWVERADVAMPHRWALGIAAETTARVRVATLRSLTEIHALALHIDTDGFLLFDDEPWPSTVGEGFGQMRVKHRMAEVEIKAPQFYRFREDGSPAWHYVASGMNHRQAAGVFARQPHVATRVAYLADPDVVLPPTDVFAWARQDELLAEARALRLGMQRSRR